jgi:hypothetical protein
LFPSSLTLRPRFLLFFLYLEFGFSAGTYITQMPLGSRPMSGRTHYVGFVKICGAFLAYLAKHGEIYSIRIHRQPVSTAVSTAI